MTVSAPPTLTTAVIGELRAIVGDDAVLVERASVDEYKDPYWIPGDETHAASAVVQPSSTEQVREIMRLVTRHRIPLWPHSQGRNLGHGGASPLVRGSIQLGFQRMNRILEINEELAYAVVEPGVTWFDLHRAVRDAGYDLMTPCPDLGWGSVIGNTMDSGHTYQHYGADYSLPAGCEVVLPDGDLLRTGQGALPDSPAWHVYKRGLGPSLDALLVQSNLGIVTRMGVWLKRRPAHFAPLALVIDDDADLEAAVDTIRELRLAGHLEGIPAIYSTLRACHMLRDTPIPPGPVPFTPDQVTALGAEHGVGAWAARAGVWGTPEVVRAKIRSIIEAWRAIPSGRVDSIRTYTPAEYDRFTYSFEMILAGEPTMKATESTPPNIAHVDVSPIVPLRGDHVRTIVNAFRREYTAAGRDFGAGIMVTGERSAVVIAGIRYDRTDEPAVRAAFALGRTLVATAGALGYGDCRPHLEFQEDAAAQFGYNDHAYRRFVTRVKDAVDPAGVLSPGRYGIWPSGGSPGEATDDAS
jgi:4-cresol dehydrogenase (hydroxylating)